MQNLFLFFYLGSHWPASMSKALLATRLQIKDFDIDSNYPQGRIMTLIMHI